MSCLVCYLQLNDFVARLSTSAVQSVLTYTLLSPLMLALAWPVLVVS